MNLQPTDYKSIYLFDITIYFYKLVAYWFLIMSEIFRMTNSYSFGYASFMALMCSSSTSIKLQRARRWPLPRTRFADLLLWSMPPGTTREQRLSLHFCRCLLFFQLNSSRCRGGKFFPRSASPSIRISALWIWVLISSMSILAALLPYAFRRMSAARL